MTGSESPSIGMASPNRASYAENPITPPLIDVLYVSPNRAWSKDTNRASMYSPANFVRCIAAEKLDGKVSDSEKLGVVSSSPLVSSNDSRAHSSPNPDDAIPDIAPAN